MLQRQDLIYPDLSYKIVGCAYAVFNEIGGGHKESVYQLAMAHELKKKGINYSQQEYYAIKYNDKVVGKNFFDFYVEEKIVIELKCIQRFTKSNFDQVLNYLHISNVKLALLIRFGVEGVVCKRVINFKTL